MTKNILYSIFLAMGLLLICSTQALAKKVTYKVAQPSVMSVRTDSIIEEETFFDAGALVQIEDAVPKAEGIFDGGKRGNLAFSHFTWGGEIGSTIDLTGHNLSTFDVDINLGYKSSLIKLAGIGAGFHRSISSGDTYIPVYAVFRSSFRRRPSLFFLNVQLGYSFNTVSGSPYHGDMISELGCGLNLSQSSRAKSYIILNIGSRYFNKNHAELTAITQKYVTTVKLLFGINF